MFVCDIFSFVQADAPPESIESDLKALLLKLPLTGLDPCTTWFTRNAILTGKSASQHRRVSMNNIQNTVKPSFTDSSQIPTVINVLTKCSNFWVKRPYNTNPL